jgi:Fe-S-cluster containining protein
MRVALTLSLPFDDVVERLPADTTKGLSQTVPLALDEGPVRLTLKKRDPETMRCMFFFQVGSRGRCGIHAVRPGVCRQFPYTVNVDDETISAGPPLPCPVRWLYNEEVERRVEQDTRNWLRDIEDEKALAAAWEARDHEDKSWAAFTRFAIRRLAARFGKSADDLLAPPRRRKFSDPVVVVNDD